MKKYFLITHTDSTTYKMEINTNMETMGKPANHPMFLGHALMICKHGYVIDEKAEHPIMIACGFIKTVQVIFETKDDNHLIIQP